MSEADALDIMCRVTGLVASDDGSSTANEHDRLRVLFCPSFDPEVCVTIATAPGDAIVLAVATACTPLRGGPAPSPAHIDRDTGFLRTATFEQLSSLFRAAASAPRGQGIILDGMYVTGCLWELGPATTFYDNVGSNALLSRFAADIIALAFESTANPRCRNALAAAGRYVGLELPAVDVPDTPQVSTIAVLGVPDERREFLAALAKVASTDGL